MAESGVAIEMTPNPKKIRLDLNLKEYHELRVEVYNSQLEHCHYCQKWLPFDMFSLHHLKSKASGGDDVMENVVGCCVIGCHPD